MDDREFLMELLRSPSPSGWETAGQRLWVARMRSFCDKIDNDAYGNAWATREGNAKSGPSVMLEAHADEIGYIVKHIDDRGYLTLAPIGGTDRTIAPARRIRIFGDKGEVIALIGNTAIHLRDKGNDKALDWHELFADVGAANAEAVAEMGIRPGHPGVGFDEPMLMPGDRLTCRALDNRISGYVLARTFALLAKDPLPATVFAVNAVQEEVGSYGARMVAHRLNPDAAIVFDVTHATDTPAISARQHGKVELGKGPTLSHGGANHPAIVARLIEVATKAGIPLQHEAISRNTRTDADMIFVARDGIPSALISIPMRYMHSPVELVDMQDVEHAAALAAAFVRSLNDGERFGVDLT